MFENSDVSALKRYIRSPVANDETDKVDSDILTTPGTFVYRINLFRIRDNATRGLNREKKQR